jgi:hypothetical protein
LNPVILQSYTSRGKSNLVRGEDSRIGFTAAGVMNTTTSADLSLAIPDVEASNVECSPVTEIDNGTDRMFASVVADGNRAGAPPNRMREKKLQSMAIRLSAHALRCHERSRNLAPMHATRDGFLRYHLFANERAVAGFLMIPAS